MGFFNWPVQLSTELGPAAKVMSFSFAPYRDGYSPLEAKFPTQQHIHDDIDFIARKTSGLRTYSSREGLEHAHPKLAAHGLELTQGAWLTHNESIEGRIANHNEISALIHAANNHPKTIKRVIVGNEVLLRGDMEIEPLIEYIRAVKRAVKQPVSYADVWSMYLKHPELINEVDFITIHILPYWEDEPISVDQAPAHLLKIINQVKAEAESLGHTKPIFIGETGWPAQGRQRGQALPSPVNQAQYVREVVKLAQQENLDYNIVEAFNQPWKAKLEGKVGAYWGMFNSDREQVYGLTGPVEPKPGWINQLLGGAAIAALALLLSRRKLNQLPHAHQLLLAGIASLIGTALTIHLFDVLNDSTDCSGTASCLFTWVLVMLIASTGWLAFNYCLDRLGKSSEPQTKILRIHYWALVLIALGLTWQLATYGRYLEFQNTLFAAPVIGLCLMSLCNRIDQGNWLIRSAHSETFNLSSRILMVCCVVASIVLVAGEARSFMYGRDFQLAHPDDLDALAYALQYTLINAQLLLWLACLCVMAFTFRILPKQKCPI